MKLENTYKELRNSWYSWTIFIEGSDQELDQIKYVTYTLHPTFPSRKIVSTDPANKFARTLEGWGEFLLRATAVMKGQEEKNAELWIDLGNKDTVEEKKKYDGVFK